LYNIKQVGNFFLGPMFLQDNVKYNRVEIKNCIQISSEAYSIFKKAEGFDTIAYIFGGAGGFVTGWYVAGILAGREQSPALLIAGVGGILSAFIFEGIAIGKYNNAVEKYNKFLKRELALSDSEAGFQNKKFGIELVKICF